MIQIAHKYRIKMWILLIILTIILEISVVGSPPTIVYNKWEPIDLKKPDEFRNWINTILEGDTEHNMFFRYFAVAGPDGEPSLVTARIVRYGSDEFKGGLTMTLQMSDTHEDPPRRYLFAWTHRSAAYLAGEAVIYLPTTVFKGEPLSLETEFDKAYQVNNTLPDPMFERFVEKNDGLSDAACQQVRSDYEKNETIGIKADHYATYSRRHPGQPTDPADPEFEHDA